MSNTVTLSMGEMFHAALVGVSRQIDNIRNKRTNRYGASDDEAWRLHIEGACGEKALAKHLNLYWSGNLGNLHAPDVGDLQVRTRSRPEHNLLVHPSDSPDARFVLLTGRAPSFTLAGWCYGREAQDERYWRDPAGGRPAFFVPASALRPMEALCPS